MIKMRNVLTSLLALFLGIGLAADARAQAASGADVTPSCVTNAKWSANPIPGEDLWASGGPGGAWAAVKTNGGNVALMSLSALDTLVIETSQLFKDGKLAGKKEYLKVPPGTTIDLDTGAAASDATADVKWNTKPKSLQPVNDAMIYLCRPSDRTATPK